MALCLYFLKQIICLQITLTTILFPGVHLCCYFNSIWQHVHIGFLHFENLSRDLSLKILYIFKQRCYLSHRKIILTRQTLARRGKEHSGLQYLHDFGLGPSLWCYMPTFQHTATLWRALPPRLCSHQPTVRSALTGNSSPAASPPRRAAGRRLGSPPAEPGCSFCGDPRSKAKRHPRKGTQQRPAARPTGAAPTPTPRSEGRPLREHKARSASETQPDPGTRTSAGAKEGGSPEEPSPLPSLLYPNVARPWRTEPASPRAAGRETEQKTQPRGLQRLTSRRRGEPRGRYCRACAVPCGRWLLWACAQGKARWGCGAGGSVNVVLRSVGRSVNAGLVAAATKAPGRAVFLEPPVRGIPGNVVQRCSWVLKAMLHPLGRRGPATPQLGSCPRPGTISLGAPLCGAPAAR